MNRSGDRSPDTQIRLGYPVPIMILCFVGLYLISKGVSSRPPFNGQTVILLTSMLVISGVFYLVQIHRISRNRYGPNGIVWIICTGIILRILVFFSNPMVEDDFYRYMWDGAVTSGGFNPYKYSPEEILMKAPGVPGKLMVLAEESNGIIERINHPHLRTIYPPVAQTAFALASIIRPWSILSWRAVLLIFDFLTLVLLLKTLKRIELHPNLLAIFWLNPLLITVTYNSCHMDLLMFPFLLISILLALQQQHAKSAVFLLLAAGVKLWPVILLPLIIQQSAVIGRKETFKTLCVCALFFFLVFIASGFLSGPGDTSSLGAYSQSWENNSSLFRLILGSTQWILPFMDIHPGHGQLLSRIIAGILVIGWTFYVVLKKTTGDYDLYRKTLAIVAAVFLLSPTQFPWYYIWLLPFLVIRPSFSLLCLTVLMPLYYLQYFLEAGGRLDIFSDVIVWVEFVPIWLLLGYEYLLKGKKLQAWRDMQLKR